MLIYNDPEKSTKRPNILSSVKQEGKITLGPILQMLSEGLTDDVKGLTVSQITKQMDKNGDGNVTDKEIAKWIKKNLTPVGEQYLPVLLRPTSIFNLAVTLSLRANDRSEEIAAFHDALAPLGGDCQLQTILDIGNALLLPQDNKGGYNV